MSRNGDTTGKSAQVCDYCGEDIVTVPFRRKGRSYCSRTCAEEHEFCDPEIEGEASDETLPEEEREYD